MHVQSLRELGALVRERRRERGLTQAELAEGSGVQRHWVAQLERGTSNPTLEPLLRTFRILELQLDVRPLEQFERQERHIDLDELLAAQRER